MASPNISFDSIPASIRKPGQYFEFNTKLAVRTLPGNPMRVLIVGQRLATGTVAANVLTDVFSDTDAAVYFGQGSQAHRMVKAAIKANAYVQLTVVAVDDDAAGVVSAGTITLAGAATAAGSVSIQVGAESVAVAADAGDTAATVAASLVTAINQAVVLPVTAAAAAGVITLTAKHKGAEGNNIKLAPVSNLAGVTATLTTAMTGGQNDPEISDALAAAFAAGHNIVVCPFATAAAASELAAYLNSVTAPQEQRDAFGVLGAPMTLSAATTLALGVNSGWLTWGWHPGSQMLAGEVAAVYAAECAFEQDPARPLNTLRSWGWTFPIRSIGPAVPNRKTPSTTA